MIDLMKFVPDKYKKKVVVAALILFVVCLVLYIFWIPEDYAERTKHVAAHIEHETNRTERVIDAIDKRKEAELNEVKMVVLDDVIDALDGLLGLHSGK